MQPNLLAFAHTNHNYWPVYEVIKQYYPIGIGGMSNVYPGLLELGKRVLFELRTAANFAVYKELGNRIAEATGLEVLDTTNHDRDTAASARLVLESVAYPEGKRVKSLRWFVSVLGPFYTLLWLDENHVPLGEYNTAITANAMAVAPAEDTEKWFQVVRTNIASQFPGYRLVPPFILQQEIAGIYVRMSRMNKPTQIFHALFADDMEFPALKYGDIEYGEEQWRTPEYDPTPGWSSYAPFR